MNKKLRDRYLIISAIQLLVFPAVTILQQMAASNQGLIERMTYINAVWPEKYPLQRLTTTAVIFFVLLTWAIMHFHHKNRRYQDPKDRIYPMLPAEMAMTMLGYTAFISYLGPDVISTFYYAVILLTIAMVVEVAKVAHYLVSCPNETIQPKLKEQKRTAAKAGARNSKKNTSSKNTEFVKRTKRK